MSRDFDLSHDHDQQSFARVADLRASSNLDPDSFQGSVFAVPHWRLSHSSLLDESRREKDSPGCGRGDQTHGCQGVTGLPSEPQRHHFPRTTAAGYERKTQPEQTETGWNCIKTDTAESHSLKTT